MKKLILLLLLFSSICFADNTPILENDFSITLPDIIYQGQVTNYKIVLKYGNGSWSLFSIEPNKPEPKGVDSYGSGEQEILSEINSYRAKGAPCSTGGKAPLTWNTQLSKASLDHSIDMAVNNYFNHIGLDGRSPWDRTAAAGFTGYPIGENIAAGYSKSEVVLGWINSPGHCSAIMNSSANVMGYGWATKSGTEWGIYYTMIVGRE